MIRNISLDWNEKEILQDPTIRTVKLQLPMFNILAENKFEILFLGVVHKLRLQVGGPKMSTFCQHLYHRKCQHRWVGGKKPKILST